VNFLQTGNERLNDISKMVHRSQLNFFWKRMKQKDSELMNKKKEAEDVNKVKKVSLLGMFGNSTALRY
jgi:hypothetical protein